MRIILGMALLIASTITGNAGKTVDAGGIGRGTSANEQEVIGKGHILIKSATTYDTFKATDAGSPYHGMKGRCWGAIEIKAPGASGHGHCAFATPSGDKQFSSWSVQGIGAKGEMYGTWKMVGGTGKLAGAIGGGTFSTVADPKANTFVNTIKGSMTLR